VARDRNLLTIEIPVRDRNYQTIANTFSARPAIGSSLRCAREPRFHVAARRATVPVRLIAVVTAFLGIDSAIAAIGRACLGHAVSVPAIGTGG
jgi:hypothetical protein